MGTWGHGSFANDSAMDWLGELADGGSALLVEALDAIGAADEDAYLEFDESAVALVAA